MAAKAKAAGQTLQMWRLSNLYWVVDERASPPRKVKFKPNPIQLLFLRAFHWLNVVLKCRQIGMSSLQAILILDQCLTKGDFRAGIIDITDEDAKKKLAKIRFAYDHLDDPDDPSTAPIGAAIKDTLRLVAPSGAHALTWNNGSSVQAGTSLIGSTISWLWVTELGKIAADNPSKAEDIAKGSFNTVHPGNVIVIESTHEGGRHGLNYQMIRQAQQSAAKPNQMQWKFHFFGWQDNPEYALALSLDMHIPAQTAAYFADLEKSIGRKLTREQKNWYVLKSQTPGVDMARQFPGTAEEALRAQIEGAIYGEQMTLLRAQGRICDFAVDGHAPIDCFWDIGMGDPCAIWPLQFIGYDIHAIDYYAANGATPAQHAAQILMWEKQYRPIRTHYLPHDANNRGLSGKTFRDLLEEAGIRNLVVVPRTPDLWASINKMRGLLPRFYFHATNCEREFEMSDNIVWPSGIGSMESYRKKLEATGSTISEIPVHDAASHGASALRTFADAHAQSMLVGTTATDVESRRLITIGKTLMGRRGTGRRGTAA